MRRRVLIKNPNLFFKEITKKESLRKFCSDNNFIYSTTKQWARGELLIPEDKFRMFLKNSSRKSYWLNKVDYKEENWGAKKGSRASINKSKEELNFRMKRARRAIKNKPKKIKLKINEGTCEFFGALMGDGCITKHKLKDKKYYKYIIIFSGHKSLDKEYHEKYLKDLIKKEFKLNSSVQLGKVKNVRTFFDALQTAGIFIESFELNRSVGAWLKAVTRNGYSILFDPNSDVLKQADNASLLLREQIKDVSVLEYIDVRFGDHVYYK